jgi:hypothetical protein
MRTGGLGPRVGTRFAAATVRIFVAIEPADLRGSFDALAGRVRRQGGDPLDGHPYVFLNARRTLMKVLWFDRNGWAIYAKRIEQVEFARTWKNVVLVGPVGSGNSGGWGSGNSGGF